MSEILDYVGCGLFGDSVIGLCSFDDKWMNVIVEHMLKFLE
jgi:hypothetical protein